MWQGLHDQPEAFSSDDEVRAVVLSGVGERVFESGADISELAEQRSSEKAVAHYNDVADAVTTLPKPIIAKID